MKPKSIFSQRWMLPLVVSFTLWALADLILVHSHSGTLWKELQSVLQTQLQQLGSPQVFAQVPLTVLGTLAAVFFSYLLIFENPRFLQRMISKGQVISCAPIVVFPRPFSWSIGLVLGFHAAFKLLVCLPATSQVLAGFNGAELRFLQPWVYSELLQFLGVDLLLLFIFCCLTRPQRIQAPITATHP